jgi:hypothetical protein
MNIVHLVKTRILYPDRQSVEGSCSLPEEASARYYSALRDYCEPILNGPMERVVVYWDFYEKGHPVYSDMFVHESGMLLHLDINAQATAVYRHNTLRHFNPPPPADSLPAIHGNAILFARKVWF